MYWRRSSSLKLYHDDLFKDTILVIGKETGFNGCHEFIFLVPVMESENAYDEIEDTIYTIPYENINQDELPIGHSA